MHNKAHGVAAAGIIVLLLADAALGQSWGGSDAPAVGKKAAEFSAKCLSDKEIKFPDAFRGKVVLLDFWATWCLPCVGEVPHLTKVYEKHRGPEFEIVGITLDKGRGVPESRVREFIKKHKMEWEQIYADGDKIATKYHVAGIPAPFLVDGDTGKILAIKEQLRGEQLARTVEKHVKAKAEEKKTSNKAGPEKP